MAKLADQYLEARSVPTSALTFQRGIDKSKGSSGPETSALKQEKIDTTFKDGVTQNKQEKRCYRCGTYSVQLLSSTSKREGGSCCRQG